MPRDDRTGDALTTMHLRKAREGDVSSLEWIVRRFTGLLLASARYRLGDVLKAIYDPEDVVNDVWAIALPRLADLRPRDGHVVAVLVKFLATCVIRRCNDLLKRHRNELHRRVAGMPPSKLDALIRQQPAVTTDLVRKIVRDEQRQRLADAIAALSDKERELVILRGIDQLAYATISVITGRDEKVLAAEYSRALKRLRAALPESVLDDGLSET